MFTMVREQCILVSDITTSQPGSIFCCRRERKGEVDMILNIIFGILAGWIAGKLMGSDGNVIRNLILGLCGGVIGSIFLHFIGITGKGRLASLFISVVGACILIWLARMFV